MPQNIHSCRIWKPEPGIDGVEDSGCKSIFTGNAACLNIELPEIVLTVPKG
jgi:hypothetical protein